MFQRFRDFKKRFKIPVLRTYVVDEPVGHSETCTYTKSFKSKLLHLTIPYNLLTNKCTLRDSFLLSQCLTYNVKIVLLIAKYINKKQINNLK